jgi:hypothetical protein
MRYVTKFTVRRDGSKSRERDATKCSVRIMFQSMRLTPSNKRPNSNID